MRSISINNNLLRYKILNCYIFAIMTLLICDAMTLISDEYKILYAEIRSKRRKMRCNYNSETRLQNNNRYAKAVVYKARWHSALQDTVAIKLYRAIFVIKLLI
ncbi:hypothetical protein HBI56_227970 [Parastagonospora nodorum]|nr:hypothetical protein HBI56_227970 [Parastagonospora nodorum]